MSFNLDIIEQIGRWCDTSTHLNLCLADKSYYETQRLYLETKYTANVIITTKELLTKCELATNCFSRLKVVHQVYRFLINDHPHFIHKQEKLKNVMLTKLEEYRAGNEEGLRMGLTPYRKYRKVLLRL